MYDPVADTAEPMEWLPADEPYPDWDALVDDGLKGSGQDDTDTEDFVPADLGPDPEPLEW